MADYRTAFRKDLPSPFIPARRGNERRAAVCGIRQAGAVRLLMLVTLLLIVKAGVTQASMFVCRDKSGAMNFTNAPSGANCKAHSLQDSSRIRIPVSEIAGGGPTSYDQDISKIARRYQLDPPLIKAIIHTESDFNSRAVSRRGAQGLMQLMPETARDLHVVNPFNPRENIDGGTRYMRYLMDSFKGDLILSLAAYNAGPGLVSRTGGVPQIQETREYVHKVLKRYKAYKSQQTPLLVKE